MRLGILLGTLITQMLIATATEAASVCPSDGPAPRLESLSAEYKAASTRFRNAVRRMNDLPKETLDEAIRDRYIVETDRITKLLALPEKVYHDWRNTESKLQLVCAERRSLEIELAVKDASFLKQELARVVNLVKEHEARTTTSYARDHMRETERIRKESLTLEQVLAKMKRDLQTATKEHDQMKLRLAQ